LFIKRRFIHDKVHMTYFLSNDYDVTYFYLNCSIFFGR
jgi:hypothetical protein